jgi:hypothetical protein
VGDPLCTFGVPSARRPYDEIDGAAPSTGAVEGVLSLSQALWTMAGSAPRQIVSLDLQQDALLWTQGAKARMGEAVGELSLGLGPATFDGQAHYDWTDRAFTVLSALVRARDSRSDEAHASLLFLRASSSEQIRAGIDELFSAVRLATPQGDLSGSLGAGFTAILPFDFRLAYDYSKLISATPLLAGLPDQRHSALLTYETSCHCAGLSLGVIVPMRDGSIINGPIIHFVIDLKQLGSFAPL